MIYVHIPFCKSFCTYCGFYSETAGCYGRYLEALRREIEFRKTEIEGTEGVNTLYIGGGTPSVLPLPLLAELAGALKKAAGVERFDEFTLELNPDDVVPESCHGEGYPEALKELGVTRVSMGVQSLHDPVLRWMNRRHDRETALRALRSLFKAGIDEVSVDLIFGLPLVRQGGGSSGRYVPLLPDSLWRGTLEEILRLGKGRNLHVSAYQLSVEPDSALERMIADGRCRELPDEDCERQYGMLCGAMAEAGYNHYEISNFAPPGHEAVHNSAYWRHVPYVGFGPGAHSLELLPDGGRRRSWNLPDLALYLETYAPEDNPVGNRESCLELPLGDSREVLRTGRFEALRGGETLSREQIVLENVMLGLRTSAGCPLPELEESCGAEALGKAVADGHLVQTGISGTDGHLVPAGSGGTDGRPETAVPYYRIPEKYFFISDNIISSLVAEF